MNIGINASFLRKPGTGIGQVTFSFLEKLKELPTSDEFFIYTEEEYPEIGYPKHFHFRNFLPFWKRDDLIRKWLWERQVAREAKKDGCDVFLSLYQTTTIFPAAFHHVMVVHDIIPRLFPEYRGNMRQKWYWQVVERGIRQANHIITISEATKKDLLGFGIVPERITVAYPDTASIFKRIPSKEEEQRVLEKYSLKPGYIYHGGGLEIRKNTAGLLHAYKQLVDHNQTVPPLVISGKIFSEQNPLATPVRKMVRELGLEKQVQLLDFVPETDLPTLYKNALFFIYPSFYEGFGLPVLEAICMGTPVLVSDTSSLREVAGEAALYIDPHSIDSIASGMSRVIADASLLEPLRRATQGGQERFSWQRFVEAVIHSLKER